MMIDQVVLSQTGNHAYVIDTHQYQWFCRYERRLDQEVEKYLLDVFLFFVHDRRHYFDCDVA